MNVLLNRQFVKKTGRDCAQDQLISANKNKYMNIINKKILGKDQALSQGTIYLKCLIDMNVPTVMLRKI